MDISQERSSLSVTTIEEMLEVMELYPKLTSYFKLTEQEVRNLPLEDGEIDDVRLAPELHTTLTEFCEATEVADQNYENDGAVAAYLEIGCEVQSFEEAFYGQWDSEEDYATELVNDCYNLEEMMGDLHYYFDYERFARDLFLTDYSYVDGYVFNNCV